MASKIIETNLPAEVIAAIDRHLTKAETKHPLFCVKMCGEGTTLETVKTLLKKSRENRDAFKTADWVLAQEVQEVFEAYLEGRYKDCREEIYDTIAVLLRMDKMLDAKIEGGVSDGLAEAEDHSV